MEANIELAQTLFKKNKYQETIDTCNQILTTDSNSIEAIKLIGKSFLATRKIDNARLYFNKALDLKSDDFESIKNLGNTYQAVDDSVTAKSYYQKAIKINCSYAPALTNLGSIELSTGNKQEGLSLLIKATESDPQLAPAWGNLANGYIQLGKTKDAEIACRKAIELNPNLFNSHFLLATILMGQNKLKEAEQTLRKTIELKSDSFQAYLNLGAVLKDLGQLEEAELSTRKAIELNPNLFNSHFLLATILMGQKKLKEAEQTLRKTIELKPDFFQAYLNLGAVLKDLGQFQEAELSTRKAIELNPNFALAHFNLGNLLRESDNLQEAFNRYIKVTELDPKFPNIYESITMLLLESNPSLLNQSKLKNILNILLEKNNISHDKLFKSFNYLYGNKIINNLKKLDSDSSNIELFFSDRIIINALKKITFKDIKLEKILTKVRKTICEKISAHKEKITYSELEFTIALGEQCFLNEYIYSLTEEENLSLNLILNRCKNGDLNEANISILSCYFPLYKLLDQIPSLKTYISYNQSFKELMILQLSEPLEEIDLSKNIKKLGLIDDEISQKVKSQYEENPYPRWRYGFDLKIQKKSITQVINIEIKPNSINQNKGEQPLKVLIAGCGTGNQILQAQMYNNAKVTAIDLSLSSLSYAQRKINELGIDNVELIQMDILEVNLLKEQFDLIECGGVLHHMNYPSIGLKELLGILKPNGFLKLGLYSELARKDIIRAKEYIGRKKLKPTKNDIQIFREDVISGTHPELESLSMRSSFYSTSECRDLCFHAQEHRFTINQLQETLKSNELEFLGFLLPQSIKSLYTKYFPEDKTQTNLQNWAKFETKHPETFRSMYQFWVCKGE